MRILLHVNLQALQTMLSSSTSHSGQQVLNNYQNTTILQPLIVQHCPLLNSVSLASVITEKVATIHVGVQARSMKQSLTFTCKKLLALD